MKSDISARPLEKASKSRGVGECSGFYFSLFQAPVGFVLSFIFVSVASLLTLWLLMENTKDSDQGGGGKLKAEHRIFLRAPLKSLLLLEG
jgi:hypothetical protein